MDYIEVTLSNFTGFDPEIVIAQLAELGFESFTESESSVQAFIREDLYQEAPVNSYLQHVCDEHGLKQIGRASCRERVCLYV